MNKGHGLMTLNTIRRIAAHVTAGLVISAAAAGPALAQTVKLTQSNATVIRGGTYASANFSNDPKLATRASGDATLHSPIDYEVRYREHDPKGGDDHLGDAHAHSRRWQL